MSISLYTGSNNGAHLTFENKHDGLVEMTGTPAMTLTEEDDYHRAPDIHWVTPTTQTRIEFITQHIMKD